MFKFLFGAVMGAGLVYVFLVYPKQAHGAIDTAVNVIHDGASSVSSATAGKK
jgi:hypothetical protein